MSVVFDKLSFVKRLEDAGTSSRPQPDTLSDAFHQAVSETVATKQDVTEVRKDLSNEIALLRTEFKYELNQLRTEVQQQSALTRAEVKTGLAELKRGDSETRVWAVSLAATVVAVLAAMKYFG